MILYYRHEIFPEFSGFPEISRPRRPFSWKSQIRFNIFWGMGGGVVTLDCDLGDFLHSLLILTHQLQLHFVCVYI